MEILRFLKWNWDRFELWQRAFVGSMFLLGASLTAGPPWDFWLRMASMLVVFGFMVKWTVWDGISSSWTKYKQARNELLTTIKNSDIKE